MYPISIRDVSSYLAPPDGQNTSRNLTLQKVAKIGMILSAGVFLAPLGFLAFSVSLSFTAMMLTSTLGLIALTTAAICHRSLVLLERKNASDYEIESFSSLFKTVLLNRTFKAKFLLACGANPNTSREGVNEGDTPLHLTARVGNVDLMICLIKAGANLNVQNANSRTPLHEAISKRQIECVRILKQCGANKLIKGKLNPKEYNSTLVTPLELAANKFSRNELNNENYQVNLQIYQLMKDDQG